MMKHITATILTLAMLATMTACGGNNDTPATTTATTENVITTVGEGSALPPETTENTTTAPVTEVPFDTEAFLADATVYEVTTDTATDPLNVLDKMSDADKPKKIALRFTDAEGLVVCMELKDTNYYSANYIFNNSISFSVGNMRGLDYLEKTFRVQTNSEITIITNGDEGVTDYYVLCGNEYDLISNYAPESGYSIVIYLDDNDVFRYGKYNWKYSKPKYFGGIVEAYEADEDFYCEIGIISFENGKVNFFVESTMTLGEYCKTDNVWHTKELFEKYGVDSFGELAELYRQYVSGGRENEFFE